MVVANRGRPLRDDGGFKPEGRAIFETGGATLLTVIVLLTSSTLDFGAVESAGYRLPRDEADDEDRLCGGS